MAEEEKVRERHLVAFTQAGCGPCQMLKMYIEQRNVKCQIIEVDVDIDRELLKRIYPYVEEAGFPFCTVEGSWVPDLMSLLESGL